MQAIQLDPFRAMIFSNTPFPDDIRAEAERLGGRVLNDVSLDRPADPGPRSDGPPRPEEFVYRVSGDPGGYFVPGRRSVNPSLHVSTGLIFREFALHALRAYLRDLKDLDEIASDTDESDTPDFWDAVAEAVESDRGA